jgi:outer membrane protein
MQRTVILGAALAGAVLPGMAWAQDSAQRAAPAADWTVTIGIEGRVMPAFVGSDRYLLAPFPIIDIREAGTPRRFSSPRDGLSAAVVTVDRFRFGPTANVALPRRQSSDAGLAGLGDVGWTLELGAFAEYWALPWLRTRVEVRQGLGGHHGIVSDITADAVVPLTNALTLSAGPRMTLATADALRPYFGVNAAQSLGSGLPIFEPKGGVRSFGFGVQARQQWSAQWATNLFLEYDRLVGDAARSPIVAGSGSPNQLTVGLGVSYAFDFSLR